MSTLPLAQMSVAEKLSAMEELWADLSQTPGALTPPDWHRPLLEQRQDRVEDGTAQFDSWDSVKDRLRNRPR